MALIYISRSVGKDGFNSPGDVAKIANGLTKLGYLSAFRVVRTELSARGSARKNECPPDVLLAIEAFQEDCFGADKPSPIVSAGSPTLAILNQLIHPLEITTVATNRRTGGGKRIKHGGFVIKYKGIGKRTYAMPKRGFQLLLQITTHPKYVDVTARPSRDLIDPGLMVQILNVLESTQSFGKKVPCRLIVRRGSHKISESKPKLMTTPIQPHNGQLLPLDQKNNGPKLTYQGTLDPKSFYGRTIVPIPGMKNFQFMYLYGFETDTTSRGFDCTTYAGTVLGAKWEDQGGRGEDLKNALGLSPCVLKKTDGGKTTSVTLSQTSPDNIKAYFATKRTGVFMMYKSSHVMLVYNGEVHEFTKDDSVGVDGYRCTPINTRLDELAKKANKKLTLCLAKKSWNAAHDSKAAIKKANAMAEASMSRARGVAALAVASAAAR